MPPENVQEEEPNVIDAVVDAIPNSLRNEPRLVGPTPLPRESLVVFKFGGTSLLGAQRMLHAAGLVRAAAEALQVAVVVSAMKGVTDRLLSLAQLIATRHPQRA